MNVSDLQKAKRLHEDIMRLERVMCTLDKSYKPMLLERSYPLEGIGFTKTVQDLLSAELYSITAKVLNTKREEFEDM